MAAQVSCGIVLDEQRAELLQQAGRGPVLGHRPHRVMARHQQVVGLGASQPLLQPGQLPVGIERVQRSSGPLVREVVGVSTQHDGVQHDDGQRLPRVGNTEVELIVVSWEFPTNDVGDRFNGSELGASASPLTTGLISGCSRSGPSHSLRGRDCQPARTREPSETLPCTRPQMFAEKRRAGFNQPTPAVLLPQVPESVD